MKYVLALILSLLFTVTAYASPEIYSNGMYKEKIIYLGTMNKGTESGYYIYSTQESLEANYNKTNYHNYNIQQFPPDGLISWVQIPLRLRNHNPGSPVSLPGSPGDIWTATNIRLGYAIYSALQKFRWLQKIFSVSENPVELFHLENHISIF